MRKSAQVNLLNLVGLSVSFVAFLLLSIYIYNEFTYDYHNENLDQIYRLNIKVDNQGEIIESAYLPNPLADLLVENIPELETLCSFAWGPQIYNREDDVEQIFDLKTRSVDSTFTEVFTLKMKYGREHPLKGKDKIIISESAAQRIFGDENPMGKLILANFSKPYEISGVFYDLPLNTNFHYDAFCSFTNEPWALEWTEYSFNHYFLVSPNAHFDEIVQKIKNIPTIDEHIEESPDFLISYSFTPLSDIHFDHEGGGANKSFVYALVAMAVLLVFMAFVNFINFAIANVPKMLKTANIRRVVGESEQRIMVLYAVETAFLVLVSYLLAILLVAISIHLYPDIFGYEIALLSHWKLIGLILLAMMIVGSLVSIYPAWLIVNVKPAMALKGLISFSAKNGTPGKILTVIQYTISILLIIGVLFIEKQVDFLKHYDLGFHKENILVVDITPEIMNQEESFATEMLKNPYITDYAYSQFVPGGVGMGWGRDVDGKQVNFKCWPVDERYLSFMGFEIIGGRAFSDQLKADENNFIFNETAIKKFGWNENYLGKEIQGFDFTGKIVGQVKDLKYASLHEEVQPMCFWLTSTRHNKMSLKIDVAHIKEAMNHVNKIYNQFEKKYSIEYSFLDESLDTMYKAEEKQAELIFVFSIISIIISIVGAFGLIIFMSEYRVKEIGVRKVNGASIGEVVRMLNWSFLKWVVVAFFIAVPLSYLIIDQWLQGFAYRTDLSWWVFVIAGFIAILITVITVSWQSYKAASRNPVEALRYE
jgi:putative ABC transport system permease protein